MLVTFGSLRRNIAHMAHLEKKKLQGLVSELQRSFDMLHDSAADDVEYYKEIFRLVDDLDQDLDESLQ